MNLTERGVAELRRQLKDRAVSSAAVADALIARTEAQAGLNGYVAFDAEALRAQARAADARIAAGEDLPLLGVPVALKDNIDAVGLPSGAGTGALHGLHPARDAEVVRRLRAAGALIAGKTGMHELAFGITTNNSVTGAARNPWDPSRIPGGSSGGSGVVVAAGLVPAAIGTDTGGSVRVPAALCGVVGLRPTVGRVSGRGIAPISSTRDTAGPIARSVEDCALLDRVLADGDPAQPAAPSLAGLRLGIARDPFWEELEGGVREVAQAALERLRAAGVEIVEVALPGLGELNGATGFPIALYEFVRDMGAYLRDAERGIDLQRLVDGIGSPDVAAIARPLLAGGAVPEAAYQEALRARLKLQALYADAFASSGVQALLMPTTPLTAAPIGDDETVLFNGRRCPTFPTFIRNTDPGSNAGIPGITLPAGLAAGLPVGLGLDGPAGSDRRLLALAAAIEAILPAEASAPWLR
ncbi:indoleacetamide hydrolase [Variovorax saccharolyticus]|uniref:indoleacetamide hydrolase n=1 Tax=Variovorax saccharolyticus TaxID=3053516 RepID=UPI0025757CD7|nr:indoleacetamide hydrolase [Variovorax sp. J31P216]MDM0024529.1 indoleacetamide hydrolase [Variovorax sp. J31P216]